MWQRLASGVFVCAIVAVSVAADAQVVTPYEWVYQAGRNNLIDSNAESCDAGQGCYDRAGALCSAAPGALCDLQVVPKGRCRSEEHTSELQSPI